MYSELVASLTCFHATRQERLGRPTSSNPLRPVGTLKCNVFVLPSGADFESFPRPFSHNEFSNPRHYVVRLYVLRAINLFPKDENGFSDPILKVELGRKTILGSRAVIFISFSFFVGCSGSSQMISRHFLKHRGRT